MEEVFNKIIDGISETVPSADNEYMGEDGLLRCSICNIRVQTEVEILGKKRKVRCICDCKRKELAAYAEREKKEEIERSRRTCFAETNMASWTFENDDGQNAKLSEAMKRYVNNFTEFRRQGKGLLLYGSVGTGKTYFAACIANSLLDSGYDVLMTNFASLTNKIQGMFDGKQEFIESLNKYSLIIIDDLGTERKSEFMQEMVFNIIDSRYRAGLPLIITTNLTMEELTKPQAVGFARIYDRILERCLPIKVEGSSRRRQGFKDNFSDIRNKLGL